MTEEPDLVLLVFSLGLTLSALTLAAGMLVMVNRVRVRASRDLSERFLSIAVEEDASLDGKIQRLAELNRASTRLSQQIQLETEAQVEVATRIRQEADAARSLAELTTEERDAVAKLVRAEISTEINDNTRRSRRAQYLRDAALLMLGAAISTLITLFVRPLF